MGQASALGRPAAAPIGNAQAVAPPNDLDWWRIKRSLRNRARYRYVSPRIHREEAGYRIVSPCCSRNVDPEGGPVDIARLCFDAARNAWCLYARNHALGQWELQAMGHLHELLAQLNRDPERKFWQ